MFRKLIFVSRYDFNSFKIFSIFNFSSFIKVQLTNKRCIYLRCTISLLHHLFVLIYFLLLNVKQVPCRQHIVGSWFSFFWSRFFILLALLKYNRQILYIFKMCNFISASFFFCSNLPSAESRARVSVTA